jgi:hypothetical protein
MSGIVMGVLDMVAAISVHSRDPLAWGILIVCVALGLTRRGLLYALIAALVVTAIEVPSLWSWWGKIGVDQTSRTIWVGAVHLVMTAVAYFIGRLIGLAFGESRSVDEVSNPPCKLDKDGSFLISGVAAKSPASSPPLHR